MWAWLCKNLFLPSEPRKKKNRDLILWSTSWKNTFDRFLVLFPSFVVDFISLADFSLISRNTISFFDRVFWFSFSFRTGGGGGSSKTLAGSLRRILALQCSLKFTARKNWPIHDSHVNWGSVVGLGQNAGTPKRSVRSSSTETARCALWDVNRQTHSYKVIVIKCELVNEAMLRYLYLSPDNERVIFIQQWTLTWSASTVLDIVINSLTLTIWPLWSIQYTARYVTYTRRTTSTKTSASGLTVIWLSLDISPSDELQNVDWVIRAALVLIGWILFGPSVRGISVVSLNAAVFRASFSDLRQSYPLHFYG